MGLKIYCILEAGPLENRRRCEWRHRIGYKREESQYVADYSDSDRVGKYDRERAYEASEMVYYVCPPSDEMRCLSAKLPRISS